MKHLAVLGAFLVSTLVIASAAAAAALDLDGRPFRSGHGPEGFGPAGFLFAPAGDHVPADSFFPEDVPIDFGWHRLTLSYYQPSPQPRSILARSIVSDGRMFSVDDKVGTGLDYAIHDFVCQYRLFGLEDVLSGFSAGIVGQVRLAEGQTAAAGERNRPDFSTPVPLVGMDLHMDFLGGFLAGRVRAAGMGYRKGKAFDGKAELSLTPTPALDIHGGYRFFFIDLESDGPNIKKAVPGPTWASPWGSEPAAARDFDFSFPFSPIRAFPGLHLTSANAAPHNRVGHLAAFSIRSQKAAPPTVHAL
ncbi:MAG: hypothetical protein M0017_00750 [Desulfobacteraceae bacterium]|nr:hypothetical protein [Desulfobacteraceae bacterium]